MSSYPDDDMPIQSKGGYQLDFDNLDAINPFQGSNKMMLSPARPPVENAPTHETEPEQPEDEKASEEPAKIESALDETLPFTQSVENSLVDISSHISSTESSVVTVTKVEAPDSFTATPDEKSHDKLFESVDEEKVSGIFVEDAPLPAKGSYTLDFDNLDAINPFQTGGSKIPNSPLVEREAAEINPPAEVTQIKENTPPDDVVTPEVAQEGPVQPEMKPMAAVAPLSANVKQLADESKPSDAPAKEGPVKLEFNFDDANEVKQKPPPKKIGKRPPGLKSKAAKPSSDVKPPKETPAVPETSDADVQPPKGSYSIDFDKFDDPNFNPFGTKTSMNNSPQCSRNPPPVPVEASILEPVEKESSSRYLNPSSSCVKNEFAIFQHH